MELSKILIEIDHQIAQLLAARALLSGSSEQVQSKKAGRPKQAVVDTAPSGKKHLKKKRNLTPEGRARIAEAVRRRWAAQKKSSSTK